MFLGEPLKGVEGYRKAIAGYEAATPVDTAGVAVAYDELGSRTRISGTTTRRSPRTGRRAGSSRGRRIPTA
jgi:hypothetical protein